MTPRQWRALAARVAERCVSPGPKPSPAGRLVLQALLARQVAGAEVPSQEVLADELGLGLKPLRGALYELAEAGVVFHAQRGSRPRQYEIDVERLREWLAGEDIWVISTDQNGSASGAETAGQTAISTYDNGSAARARAAMPSSSSSSFPPPSSAEFAPGSPEQLEHDAIIGALRRAGIRVPYALKVELRSWVGRWPSEDVAVAALEAAHHGAASLAYVETVLRNQRAREDAEAGVVRFEDYRELRPWHGGAGGA